MYIVIDNVKDKYSFKDVFWKLLPNYNSKY